MFASWIAKRTLDRGDKRFNTDYSGVIGTMYKVVESVTQLSDDNLNAHCVRESRRRFWDPKHNPNIAG